MDRQALAAEAQKEAEARKKHLIQSLNMVAATAEGQDLLRFVLELSGHKKHKAVVDPTTGEINQHSTTYNVARESLYLTLTKDIDPKYLKKIEY